MRNITLSVIFCLAALFSLPHLVAPAAAQDAMEVVVPVEAEAPQPPADIEPAAEVTGTAPEAPEDDLLVLATQIVKSAKGGNWSMLAAAVLSLMMTLAWKLKLRRLKFFKGDRGGIVLLMGMSMAGSFSTALYAGQALSLEMAWGATKVAIMAAGGWQLLKRAIWPKDSGEESTPATDG